MILALLVGCSSCAGRPDSVPEAPGKITAEDAADLLTGTSPDLPILPWLAVAQLAREDYRDCPLVYLGNSTVAIDAGSDEDGCLDSAGVRWRGQASVSYGAGGALVFSFDDFGPIEGVDSPWTGFGNLSVTLTDAGTGMRVSSRMELTSHGPGDDLVFWVETEGGYAFYDGVFYVDHAYGDVGIMDWGTTEIDVNRVPLSLTNGCAYGAHPIGTIGMFAKNDGVFTFQAAAAEEEAMAGFPAPPPPSAADTGADPHTGGGGGGGGGGSIEIPSPMGVASGYCGECTTLAIEGVAVEGCVTPTRVVSWPFFDPF